MTTRPLKPVDGEHYWHVSPERYLSLLSDLGDAMSLLTPPPDAVVGIKRSGLFPAVYLSHRFKLPMFTDGEAKVFPFPKFQHPVVVDTAVWSGKSVRQAAQRLRKRGVVRVSVLVMFARDDPLTEVDELHYLELTDRIMHFWYSEEEP